MKNIFKSILTLIMFFLNIGLAMGQITDGKKVELVVQTGHSEGIKSVTFSPDGKTLASGGRDDVIKLWDVFFGTQLKTLSGHEPLNLSGINSVVYSPDGTKLASGSGDKTIKIWDAVSGQELKTLAGHKSEVGQIIFSPDGKMLASASWDKTIKVWDASSGSVLQTLTCETCIFVTVAFSPDGKTLASASDGKPRLWNVETGTELKIFSGPASRVNVIAFSPDGRILLSGGWDGTIKLWDLASGQLVKTLSGHKGEVQTAVFSPDGKTIASGGEDSLIKLWDAISGKELKSLSGHAGWIFSVAFSPDGTKLASGSSDKTIKIWDTVSRQDLRTLAGEKGRTTSVAFAPDNQKLAYGNDNKIVKLWNIKSGHELMILSGHSSRITSIEFSPDSRFLASASFEDIRLWDASTGRLIKTFKSTEGGGSIYSIAFSRDGKIIASGTQYTVVKLWDVISGREITSFGERGSPIQSLAFSPDGKMLAVGLFNGEVEVREVKSLRLVNTLRRLYNSPESISFSPDGKNLAAEDFNGDTKIWEISSGKTIKAFSANDPNAKRSILSIVPDYYKKLKKEPTSQDGKFQLKVGENERLDLYEFETNKLIASLVATDQNDWLVVTPLRLFDGNPNAWKKLLWRFDNNIYNHAPVEAFFKEFYRPSLLQDIFAGNKIEPPTQDLSKIDIRQPIIKISAIDGKAVDSSALSPNEVSAQKKSIKVKVEITDNVSDPRPGIAKNTSSDARDVRLFRNASLVKLWKGNAFELTEKDGCKQFPASGNVPRKAVCETDVQITSGKNELTVYGFNRENVKSSDHTAIVGGAESLKRDGTLYILAVGVNEYANPAFNLKYAVPDVEAIGKELALQQSKLSAKPYAQTKVVTLTNKQATKANFVNALKRFSGGNDQSGAVNPELEKIKPIQPEDALIIYFAGHGLAGKDRFYLIPHDGIPLNFSKSITDSTEQQRLLTQGKSLSDQSGLEQLYKQSLSDLELEDLLETVNAGKLMMVIDACNSGQALEAEEKRRGPMNSRGLAQLAYEKGMNILTASQSFQAALEASSLNHGLLTYALLEGMKKGDSNNDKSIIDREWLDYGVITVPQLQIEAQNKRLLTQGKQPNSPNSESNLQTPRVFYRRESDVKPLIIALQ